MEYESITEVFIKEEFTVDNIKQEPSAVDEYVKTPILVQKVGLPKGEAATGKQILNVIMEKKRTQNFTEEEKSRLCDIILEVGGVENKHTDRLAMGEKNKAWERIAERFNAGGLPFRSTEVLKNCWENLKKRAKKLYANNKMSLSQTGAARIKEDAIIEKIYRIIAIAVEGLHNPPYDGDTFYTEEFNCKGPTEATPAAIESKESPNEKEMLLVDVEQGNSWESWNPAMLSTLKSVELVVDTPAESSMLQVQSFSAEPKQKKFTSRRRPRPVPKKTGRERLEELKIAMAEKQLKANEEEHNLKIAQMKQSMEHEIELNAIKKERETALLEIAKLELRKLQNELNK